MRLVFRAACLLLLLSPMACGTKGPSLVPVSGRVTLNNAPLADATVTFTPIESSKDEPPLESAGKIDADGNVSLELIADKRPGAVVGSHTVRISLFDRGTGDKPGKGQQVPLEYDQKSKQTFVVPEGGTKGANFALKGKLNQKPVR